MPVPAGVPLAVDADGVLHGQGDIDQAHDRLARPLRCAGCGAPIEAVASHLRRAGQGVAHVEAHYRLAPGAAHQPDCPDASVAAAATPSAGNRRLPQPLAAGGGVQHVYSLVLPEPRRPTVVAGRARPWRRRRSQSGGHSASDRAVNSAAKLAALLDSAVANPALADTLAVHYRGTRLGLADLCPEPEDLPPLAQRLADGPLPHPVAVTGHVHRRGRAASGRSTYLLFDPGQRVQLGSRTARLRVFLRSRSQWLLDSIPQGGGFLALGWWQLHVRAGMGCAASAELTLWVSRPWQLCPRTGSPTHR